MVAILTKIWQIQAMLLYHGTNIIVDRPEIRVSGYAKDFGRITREAFWTLAKFKHPTHQIVFCNDKALRTLTYKESYKL